MSQLFFCFKGQVEPAVWRLCPLLRLSYQCTDMGKGPRGPCLLGQWRWVWLVQRDPGAPWLLLKQVRATFRLVTFSATCLM